MKVMGGKDIPFSASKVLGRKEVIRRMSEKAVQFYLSVILSIMLIVFLTVGGYKAYYATLENMKNVGPKFDQLHRNN